MQLDDFSYELPPSFIAQKPLEKRDASRLMVIDRHSGDSIHAVFHDLPSYLSARDIVVVNRSRVMPARLFAYRETGGAVEVFVTRVETDRVFRALIGSSKRPKKGETLRAKDGSFSLKIEETLDAREMRLSVASSRAIGDILEEKGHVPLPPYIRRADEVEDRIRYQTVYADEAGSVAAPTAGLHFDPLLLERLRASGVEILSVVLHVGLGTFLPLDSEVVEDNSLHSERFSIEREVLQKIRDGKKEGKRIIAVGTTVTRVLESIHAQGLFDRTQPGRSVEGETELFIYPGFDFHVVDGLITNFHLPKSSLLLLVCAFLGREKTLACYNEAVSCKYRFYSYGDAMFIR
jgi:S-adenosylmethionine:tRNA ribosyltransferase-isomerase